MTNSKIVSTHPRLLTELQRQTRACLIIDLTHMPCPACKARVNQVDAAGVALDEFDASGHTRYEYRCTGCNRALAPVVPFLAPPHYLWELKEPIPAESTS